MARLFISHSSANNAQAIALRDWLFELGFKDDVFLDIDPQRGLVAGERWQQALKAAADRCEAVLFLVSPAWLASAWCRAEFLLAKSLQKRIFGLIVDPVPLAQVPVEMTAEWQICQLVGEDPVRTFDVALGPRSERITFRQAGLDVLRRGLERAGLDARSFPWPPAGEPRRAPYRGLRALEPQDAAIFFGRDAAIVRGLDRVRGLLDGGVEKLLVVLGASGAGKSSFLRAGLWPRLLRDDASFLPLSVIRPETAVITGSAGLAVAVAETFERLGQSRKLGDIKEEIARGPESLLRLLDELGRLAGERLVGIEDGTANPAIIIAIDQAEELFNADGRSEAADFLSLLAGVLSLDGAPTSRRVIAIATIRSDRYELLQASAPLATVKQALFSLPPVPPAEYKSIIEGPARRVVEAGGKLEIEPALTEQLIADTEGADALPLLAFSLEALYRDNGSAGRLALADYTRLGGVKGSIAAAVARALAEPGRQPAIAADTEAQYAALRAAFIPWLARIDPASGRPMRRVARLDEIPQGSRAIVERLVRERLLVTDRRGEADVIEVAHESLLRQWPILASWLEADLENLKLLESVERSAGEWAANGRLSAWLDHRGQRLATAEQLMGREDFRRRVGSGGEDYLAACHAREDAERRRRSFFNNLIRGSAVVIAIVAAVATWQWREARLQTRISNQRAALLSTNLAGDLVAQGEIDPALLLLLESSKSFDDATAPDKLLIALQGAVDKARVQETFYFAPDAKVFSLDRSLFVFERGRLLSFDASDRGALKDLGEYKFDVLKIAYNSDSTALIVLRSDFAIDTISLAPFAVRHIGVMAGADELKGRAENRVTIDPNGVVYAVDQQVLYAFDVRSGKAMKTGLPAGAKALRYIATFEGARLFASPNNGFVYRADASFASLTRAEALDRLWDPIYLCQHVDADINQATRDYIKSNIAWKEFRDGDVCTKAGENYVYLVREQGTSAGSEYTHLLIDTRDPKNKTLDLGEILKSSGDVSVGDAYFKYVDIIPKDKVVAITYNRAVYVLIGNRAPFNAKTASAPVFASLASRDRLLVVQKTGRQHKLTMFRVGASERSFVALKKEDKARLTPLNKGSCTGHNSVFPYEATLTDGTKLVFDTQTPTSGGGSNTIRIAKGGSVKTIELGTPKAGCVQVNAGFTRLLLKKDKSVDVYDLAAVLRNASLDGAKIASIADSTLSTSAFFVGETDDVVTSHWDNRVLRWRRGAGGYVAETIYAGDYPVKFAEPSRDGARLLLIESFSGGNVEGSLYSLSAHRRWSTIVSNYKWIGLAFASDGGIVFGDGVEAERNSNSMKIMTLSELVAEAKRLASRDCEAQSTEDYTKSRCWPNLGAE